MVSTIFSSLPGNQNFTTIRNDAKNLYSLSTPNNGYLFSHQQESSKKIQNYFQFRCAEYQRVNDFFNTSFLFIKKQTNILGPPHPGRFYLQQKRNMINTSDVQEYCRYRNATHHASLKACILPDQYLHNSSYLKAQERNENEYSRYRNSHCSRERSATRTDTRIKSHYNCRSLTYDAEAQRFPVPDDKVSWHISYPDYKPVEYSTKKILNNPKADSADPSKIKKYNQLDNKIDRRSFTGHYYVDPITKRPRNPIGRTGMTGRGRLYYWGPNHAGDPVVTRWKRDGNSSIVYRRVNDRSKPVLEFVSIQRRDTKQWALPGGMVDPGETVSTTVKREFQEEAARGGLNEDCITRLFSNGYKLFESYVDDPRNTDNAWMETVAMHFHDETGQLTNHLNLNAGDDADKVVWSTIERTLQLYACHKDIIKAAVDRLDAFW